MNAYQSGDLPKHPIQTFSWTYQNPTYGPQTRTVTTRHSRAWARSTGGHFIFRIEGVRQAAPGPWEHPVVIKLHSCQSRNWKSWKAYRHNRAATEIHLSDAEAVHLARALLVAMGHEEAADPDVDPIILLQAAAKGA